MNRVVALISLLHESAEVNSATRLFRGEPVLRWTLRRLDHCQLLDDTALLCWDDQKPAIAAAAERADVVIRSQGERFAVSSLIALAAARRWADGWRGGLLGSCDFDLGYHPDWAKQLAETLDADALVLIDPAAALVDPALVDDLIDHAENEPTAELCFSPVAPGLGGTLLRRAMVDRLATAHLHPGRLLTYWPDHHGVDPIGKNGCVAVATPLARTTSRFKLDSRRQLARIDAATADLNGTLIRTAAGPLVDRLRGVDARDPLPRDVVLELNTTRLARPAFGPLPVLQFTRGELPLAVAEQLFTELAAFDDVRLTLAGVGDPLLAKNFFDVSAAATKAGLKVNVETDLLSADPTVIDRLAGSRVDVISVHFPAATASTYERLMGVNGFGRVMENLARLEQAVLRHGRGLPLIAPVFTKTRANLAEMDGWYDYWIRRFGSAVIVGPSDFAGQIPDTAVADMAPPQRRACGRLASRMTILSDGTIVSCEQDLLGKQARGVVGRQSIAEVWQNRFGQLRQCHAAEQWNDQPLCKNCKEWHRP